MVSSHTKEGSRLTQDTGALLWACGPVGLQPAPADEDKSHWPCYKYYLKNKTKQQNPHVHWVPGLEEQALRLEGEDPALTTQAVSTSLSLPGDPSLSLYLWRHPPPVTQTTPLWSGAEGRTALVVQEVGDP